VVLIGSANLTGGGLCRNSEAGVEITVKHGNSEKEWNDFWQVVRSKTTAVTAKAVRELAARPGSGKEQSDEMGGAKSGKPFLSTSGKTAPKPLFHKLLKIKSLSQRNKDDLLGEMSALSDKPNELYIEIFERETGGSGGKSGNAVQFPVAALGAFFGVDSEESRMVTIEINNQTITPTFMHLSNNTHRLRIPQIMTVKRPAVLILKRIGIDHYKGSFAKNYKKTLEEKCDQQSRVKSRRWGIR
jgi:hypothetical protein